MLSTAKSANVGFSQVVQLFAPPTNPANAPCAENSFWVSTMCAKIFHRIHRIHRRQHASEDDAGMSKHRLSPYNAYYHNWLTLNFTASNSSSDERCLLKVLIVLQLKQLADSKFQLSTRWLYCVECPQYSTRCRSASNIHCSGMLRKNR